MNSTRTLPLKRLFLVGYFNGDLNLSKRLIWMNEKEAQANFDELHLFNPSLKEPEGIASFILHSFPIWLCDSKIAFLRFWGGIAALLKLVFSSPGFLREISVLEFKALRIVPNWRPYTILRYVVSLARGVCGLGQASGVVRRAHFTRNDTVIIWAEHMVGMRLLKKEVLQRGARLVYSEYGELPTMMFACDRGMFHESWPSIYKQDFQALSVSKEDIIQAKSFAQKIVEGRVSSKSGKYDSINILEVLEWASERPVIYINGVQEHASGLLPRCAEFSHEYSPHFGSNHETLDYFAKLGARNGWNILYKEHPNTCSYYPSQCVKENRWGDHVRIVGNMDIYEILSVADVTLSLGSKTVFLSLLSSIPVVLLGPYSISSEDLSSGVSDGLDFEREINDLIQLDREVRVDLDGLYEHLARLMKYYYYSMHSDAESPFGRGRQQFWKDFSAYLSGTREVISANICGLK